MALILLVHDKIMGLQLPMFVNYTIGAKGCKGKVETISTKISESFDHGIFPPIEKDCARGENKVYYTV